MGTLMDKLNATNATKEQIRQAIERKKVSVPTNTQLKDYPTKIDGIYPDALFFANAIYPKTLMQNLSGFVQSAHGNQLDMIVVGNGVCFAKKADDSTWRRCANAGGKGAIAFGNGWFLTLGASGSHQQQRVYRSIDGKSWEQTIIADVNETNPSSIVFDGLKFVFFAEGGAKFCSSGNGKTWSVRETTGLTTRASSDLFYDEKTKKYYAYNSVDGVKVSADGVKWTDPTAEFPHKTYSNIMCVANGRMVYKITEYTDSSDYSLYDLENQTRLLIFSVDRKDSDRQVVYKNGVFAALNFVVNEERVLVLPNNNFTGIFTTENTFARYDKSTGKVEYSYDGINYFDNLDLKVINTNDEDVTIEVVRKLADIQTSALQAAYQAGVNSI